MIYTTLTKKAMKIAYEAHDGGVDEAGVPYIFHPIHLAEQMETEEQCIVALLHDVVEDTEVTIQQLEKEFSQVIIEALNLLTHDKSVEYIEYIKKLKSNEIARKVKLKDLEHNTDLTRLDDVKEKDKKRQEKYFRAIQLLKE